MDQPGYQVVHRPPDVGDYLRLRDAAGLSPFSEVAAAKGLEGAITTVLVLFEGQAVGMGRLVGDGGCFFQIVDIAVDPAHQGRGLGKAIMSALMDFIREALPSTAYVSLIADVPANTLYEKYGFQETAPRSVGMSLIVE